MIKRIAENLVHALADQFPAVLIVGSRQCGKTTLARHFLEGEYFDLERPSDQDIFLGNIEFALTQFKEPLILDEAQTLPQLFSVIRSEVDQRRHKNGRYYLLGSVNPLLIKRISESLAGRVGIIELTPFLFNEISELALGFPWYWLKGGYPDAVREKDPSRWQRWHENYVRTFIERDIPRYGTKISPLQLRRLLGMVANQHGGLLNASELGRSLGITYHTVNDYLEIMEGHFLVRRLQPYHPTNIKKRIVKSPKLYIRDSGLLHYVLGISTERQLLESPKRGSSWEGLLIEQLAALEALNRTGSRFFFYRTHAGAELDFLIDRGAEKIGFEFKCTSSVSKKDWRTLKACIDEGVIDKGIVGHMGKRDYDVTERIKAVSGESLLSGAWE